jgi:hypothetical protein
MLKGQCHKMDIFLRSKMLISTICVSTDGFQGLSKAFKSTAFDGFWLNHFLSKAAIVLYWLPAGYSVVHL